MFGWIKKIVSAKETENHDKVKKNNAVQKVKFDSSKVAEEVKLDLRKNIQSISEVSPDDFDVIYDAALRSILAGRDVGILYQALMKIKGISKKRASEISLSLNNKATALIDVEGQKRNGIKYAVWCYSGAPCGSVDKFHKAANGKQYMPEKGMLLNGKATWPGYDNDCKCVSKSMVIGFDGYTGGKPKG